MSLRLDDVLEASVVGSFTSVGYRLRSRSWADDLPAMDGQTVLVTGGSSGIGLAAALRMKALGARVIVVGRNRDKLDEAGSRLEAIPRGEAGRMPADLSTTDGARRLADRMVDEEPGLTILVNNASVLTPDRQTSPEGIELTVATNVVAPFLLTNLLIPRLVANAPARIITVSSGGMYTEALDLDTLEMRQERYRGATAYARTKRAQVVLTEIWSAMLKSTGVVVHSTHPGWVDTPGLAASLPAFHTLMGPLLRTPDQGADTIVFLAAADLPMRTEGRFWHDRKPRPVHRLNRTRERPGERQRLWDYAVDRSGWSPPPGFPISEVI